MIKSKTIGSRIFTVVNTLILAILALSCLYPLWYTFCLSVSAKEAVDAGMVVMTPIGFNLSSYSMIMKDSEFFSSVWVSVQRVVLGTVISMVVMILIAYPLSKTNKEFKIRNVCMWVLIFTMLFSGGTIPWFMTVKYYGLIDSIWALILSGSLPVFNVILIISFFRAASQRFGGSRCGRRGRPMENSLGNYSSLFCSCSCYSCSFCQCRALE